MLCEIMKNSFALPGKFNRDNFFKFFINHNMINERKSQIEQTKELKENRGLNTEIRFTFVRHSQKTSGQIFTEGAQGLSVLSISKTGIQRAKTYGIDQLTGRKITKAYATEADRTRETLASAFQAAEIDSKILQKSETTRAFFTLPALSASEEFMKQYDAIMLPKRQQYIDKHYLVKKFNELTPDKQEAAAEYAEEPAIEWYLSFGNKRPDKKTPSPREQAAFVAFKINRLIHLPDYMPNGKSVDLISSGHKTSTEAFLKYCIERKIDGKIVVGFDKLEEIGGSLKILDSWDLQIKNDDNGKKHATIILRRENGETREYGLNISTLNELAKEYIKVNNLKPKKIDSLEQPYEKSKSITQGYRSKPWNY